MVDPSTSSEVLLERLACGELERDAPEIVTRRASDPEFDELVREWEHLSELLEEVSRVEGETQDALDSGRPAPGTELVEPTIRRHLSPPGSGTGSWRTGRYLVAVAAVIAAVFWAAGTFQTDQRDFHTGNSGVQIGRRAIALEVVTAGSQRTLRWSAGPESSDSYVVQVWPRGGYAREEQPALEKRTDETEWILDETELPDSFEWRVSAQDALGEEVASGSSWQP